MIGFRRALPILWLLCSVGLLLNGCRCSREKLDNFLKLVPEESSLVVAIPNLVKLRPPLVAVLRGSLPEDADALLQELTRRTGIDLSSSSCFDGAGFDGKRGVVLFYHASALAVVIGVKDEDKVKQFLEKRLKVLHYTALRKEGGEPDVFVVTSLGSPGSELAYAFYRDVLIVTAGPNDAKPAVRLRNMIALDGDKSMTAVEPLATQMSQGGLVHVFLRGELLAGVLGEQQASLIDIAVARVDLTPRRMDVTMNVFTGGGLVMSWLTKLVKLPADKSRSDFDIDRRIPGEAVVVLAVNLEVTQTYEQMRLFLPKRFMKYEDAAQQLVGRFRVVLLGLQSHARLRRLAALTDQPHLALEQFKILLLAQIRDAARATALLDDLSQQLDASKHLVSLRKQEGKHHQLMVHGTDTPVGEAYATEDVAVVATSGVSLVSKAENVWPHRAIATGEALRITVDFGNLLHIVEDLQIPSVTRLVSRFKLAWVGCRVKADRIVVQISTELR